ncbi:LytTR family DNA-binding domain-containing protein [Mucilaginibacter sp. L3T2-6]|uniref:LytR/AlgR family response regulator transcription factor n=1 Tax=Mucilaginibacter sp. L3T2-6 TaxID=3062491 RepID=UPI002675620B|nr:LytTR family DNA-binding domain-containing protein [Mucilaginibacter sp. L3T2-6]MDO3641301.1 LytTR family DNA-binding domain-containing protein [Mucilaginibacter sp. L3T2-6]MDV6213939.1 LytTR family DNA-binding domain-containing protein [Mucilaginibacter sp. L3T2-6]
MTRVLINSLDKIFFLNPIEIIYCKSDNNYTQIYLVNGDHFIQCTSLKRFYEELNSNDFVRISQSYLININFIKLIDKKKRFIMMSNTELLPFTVQVKELLTLIIARNDGRKLLSENGADSIILDKSL